MGGADAAVGIVGVPDGVDGDAAGPLTERAHRLPLEPGLYGDTGITPLNPA